MEVVNLVLGGKRLL